ncbi:unnamed protein product [Arctogadus glacialis]
MGKEVWQSASWETGHVYSNMPLLATGEPQHSDSGWQGDKRTGDLRATEALSRISTPEIEQKPNQTGQQDAQRVDHTLDDVDFNAMLKGYGRHKNIFPTWLHTLSHYSSVFPVSAAFVPHGDQDGAGDGRPQETAVHRSRQRSAANARQKAPRGSLCFRILPTLALVSLGPRRPDEIDINYESIIVRASNLEPAKELSLWLL